MTPFVAVISPLRTTLVPNTAAPSNWARVDSGFTSVPASTAISTRGMRTWPRSLTSTSTTAATVSHKTTVRGNAQTTSFFQLPLAPPRLFRHHLRNPAQPAGIDRISIVRRSVISVVGILQIQDARGPDQLEQILERVAAGRVREF